MKKTIVSTLLSISLLASPIIVSAQSTSADTLIESLRAQIQQLQQQIAQLLKSQGTTVSSGDDTSANASEPLPACPQLYLSRTLSLRMSGEGVRSLQDFLISQGFLAAGNNTGYFGSLTEAAVKALQTREGIESIGIVGRLTRAAIVAHCSKLGSGTGTTPVTPTQQSALNFRASPMSGTAPLTVAFSAVSVNNYSINYGDGTSGTMQSPSCAGDCMLNSVRISSTHTYNAPGTYTAKLFDNLKDCASGVDCSVASVTVIASSAQSEQPTLSVSPMSGTAPLSVQFIMERLSQRGGASDGYSLDFGDGTNPYGTRSIGRDSVTHTYAAPGTYQVKLYGLGDCPAGCIKTQFATVTVTVSSASQPSRNFSATPMGGTAPLTVSFRATAGDEEQRTVNFGDGSSGQMSVIEGGAARGVTHIYQTAGTYTATLPATFGAQQFAPITIAVSAGTNAVPYTLSAAASSTKPGFVTGSWSTGGNATSDDWVALVPAGTTWSQSQLTSSYWVWATSNSKTKNNAVTSSGSVTLSSVPAGQYQLVYYLNTKDSSGNYIEKARSSLFSILWGDD